MKGNKKGTKNGTKNGIKNGTVNRAKNGTSNGANNETKRGARKWNKPRRMMGAAAAKAVSPRVGAKRHHHERYIESLGSQSLSKAQNTEFSIIEATIQIIYNEGLPQFTFERVSKTIGLTRPLIHHYFRNKEELLQRLVAYVRMHYQGYVLDHMKKGESNLDHFELYIEYALRWVLEYPSYASLWLLFYHLTTTHAWALEQNGSFVDLGTQRIVELLKALKREGHIAATPDFKTARAIQVWLTGLAVTLVTETRNKKEVEELIQWSRAEIFHRVGVSSI